MKRNYYFRNIPPEDVRKEIERCERKIWDCRRSDANETIKLYAFQVRALRRHIRKLEKYLERTKND